MSDNFSTMRTPKPAQLRDPILEILADGRTWRFMEIVEELASRFNLTAADRERERFPNGDDRLPRYCASALGRLRDKDRLVENPARGSWRIISLIDHKKKKQRRSSKSHKPDPMLNPISIDLVRKKKTKIRNPSRKKSYYGKKIARRWITQRKQYAMESARAREPKAVEPAPNAKPIENATPTETKIPWRAPRSKPDPGTYACRTIANGVMGCITLPLAIVAVAIADGDVAGLYFLLFPIIFIIGAIHSVTKSRGGW